MHDVLAHMHALQIPTGDLRWPKDALHSARQLRSCAVLSQALLSGEHVPMFSALFDGQCLSRRTSVARATL
jgi:hypothetical protein